MIERCDRTFQKLSPTVVSARIEALYNTYSNSVGIDVLAQTVDGKMTAIFSGTDGSFSLEVFDGADYEELASYFAFVGATVFCSADTAERFNCKTKQISELYELTAETKAVTGDGHGRISDVYKMLKNGEDGDIALPPFDFWYTDFCLRFNHGAAEFAMSEKSVAVCGFMTETVSLITGIATDKDSRGMGEGSLVLHTLISNIRKRYPSSRVFAATENADLFYIKNGFRHTGQVAVCRF